MLEDIICFSLFKTLFSVYEVPEVGVLLSFVLDVMQPNQWSNPGTSQNHLFPSPGWLKVKGLV